MLNVSAIPLDEISPIWDDGFLLLSKSLLSAVTLDDFIHKLNKIDASFGGVTRVNLILNMGADEEAIFYFMDIPAQSIWSAPRQSCTSPPSYQRDPGTGHHSRCRPL